MLLTSLDSKIADYVFFPISHVLKQLESLPLSTVELSVLCIKSLLDTGWKTQIPPALGMQLIILMTFLTNSTSSKLEKPVTSEELRATALACIEKLFKVLSKEIKGRKALTDVSNVPTVSNTVSAILDNINDEISAEFSLAAMGALDAFITTFPDVTAVTSFLPGIVSALLKILTPSAGCRRHYKTLVRGLGVLSKIISNTISDKALEQGRMYVESNDTAMIKNSKKGFENDPGVMNEISEQDIALSNNKPYSPGWLKDAAAQMGIALGNISKLQNHDRIEVRLAVSRLAKIILEDCYEVLANCRKIMLETLATVMAIDSENDTTQNQTSSFGVSQTNQIIFKIKMDNNLVDMLGDCLHDWLDALPWTMQLKSDENILRTLSRITFTYRLMQSHGFDMKTVNGFVVTNLTEGLSALIKDDKRIEVITNANAGIMLLSRQEGVLDSDEKDVESYSPIILRSATQSQILKAINGFLDVICKLSIPTANALVDELLQRVQSSEGEVDLASMWLTLGLLNRTFKYANVIDETLDLSSMPSCDVAHHQLKPMKQLEELYHLALTHISESPVDVTNTNITSTGKDDWRLTALALETLALFATTAQDAFRAELIFTLYPTLQYLGSTIPILKSHAITTINTFARACSYTSASELIVSNADYLINAVSLKLNTFDVTPQAPQTLLMMVKLTGSRLLPYMDDLVENIFGLLECYHRDYPGLVELLFGVLGGMVEVGVKDERLSLRIQEGKGHEDAEGKKKKAKEVTTIEDVIEMVKKMSMGDKIKESDDIDPGGFPRRPWGKEVQVENEGKEHNFGDPDNSNDLDTPEAPTSTNDEDPGPPLPQVYNLLLRIALLTQHYLPTPLPTLRSSLLRLLQNVLPTLALHENTLLPLINTLWPVLVSRLLDDEAYVVSGALEVMASMCVCAKDFMKGRMEDVWGNLRDLYKRIAGNTAKRQGSKDVKSRSRELLHVGGKKETGKSLSLNTLGTIVSQDALISKKKNTSAISSVTASQPTKPDHTAQSVLMTQYIDSPTRLLWTALISLFIAMLENISLSDGIFDEMLIMLLPAIENIDTGIHAKTERGPKLNPKSLQVRLYAALEHQNTDVVWLALLERNIEKEKEKAKAEGWTLNVSGNQGGDSKEDRARREEVLEKYVGIRPIWNNEGMKFADVGVLLG